MTIEYEKKLAEMENVMRLQTDVIADLNKELTGLRADNAILVQEIESYRMDHDRLMAKIESESGERR